MCYRAKVLSGDILAAGLVETRGMLKSFQGLSQIRGRQ